MSLVPKNWSTFQHYKDRKPAWIKLHHALLDDYQFSRLPVASRALAPCLWLLASEYDGGEITASLEEIAFRVRMSIDDLHSALAPLVEAKFFTLSNDVAICKQAASNMLAEAEQDAIPEREKEREKEKNRADARSASSEVQKEQLGKYEFEGDVIRLTKKDFDKWSRDFPRVDLRAELAARDAWLASKASAQDRENWWHTTPAFLRNQNAKAMTAKQQSQRHTAADPMAGII